MFLIRKVYFFQFDFKHTSKKKIFDNFNKWKTISVIEFEDWGYVWF